MEEDSECFSEGQELLKWMEGIGVQQYFPFFMRAEIDMDVLPFFTQEDVVSLGIQSERDADTILKACRKLQGKYEQSESDNQELCENEMSILPMGIEAVTTRGMMPTGQPKEEEKGNVSETILGYSEDDDCQLLKEEQVELVDLTVSPQKSVSAGLENGRKRKFQASITDFVSRSSDRRESQPEKLPEKTKPTNMRRNSSGKQLPAWQKVPGCSFVVDRFSKIWGVHADTWFLTHFHADHYHGLSKSFSHGLIYCTPITANLVRLLLKVPPSRLVEMEIGKPKTIKGIRVTFLDANHCPGAVMIVFEPPDSPPVLHTGDCRLIESMKSDPLLQRLREEETILVLDTTYCDPRYCFPPQSDVKAFVVDAVKSESYSQDVLFLFGTYTIGKEKIFMEVAKSLGKKIYVSAAKRRVMGCLGLPAAEESMVTSNHSETNIHAVPLSLIKLDAMARILRRYRGKYKRAVGFQPTGWMYSKKMGRKTLGRKLSSGNSIVYQVPYSEHSSFNELADFVEWLTPKKIIPSVGNDEGPNTQKMLGLLRQKKLPALLGN